RIEKTLQSIEPHVRVSPKEEGHHHDHDHGTKNLKTIGLKLIGGAVIGTAASFIPDNGLLKFIMLFAAYLLVGGDVVL
ncbi:heavy metal translocating P-type ATPase, partial [Bacillus altitudinis]|nr:heavy metal translocating P-type ATPase [Bacillus altitudinis]